MKRNIGTMSIGVRCPIIREGDDLAKIVVDSVLAASKEDNLPIEDKDIIAVTESVLARAQGNYANVTDIADDIKDIFGGKKHVGVVFPILSRNRFSLLLKGIARGASKVTIVLSYPSDEVGNGLISLDLLDEKALVRILTEPKNALTKQYNKLFELDGVELIFTDEALSKIAQKAIERHTGARGLRSIMEDILKKLMYEVPSDETIVKITITADVVTKKSETEFERAENKKSIIKKLASEKFASKKSSTTAKKKR